MTTDLTPAQKAGITRRRNTFLKKITKNQELFRNNPRLLAREIVRQIRRDEHAGEPPQDYVNGAMHWFQESWGSFRYDESLVERADDYLMIKCPTTGCVAGWATTLAGYPMAVYPMYREEGFMNGEVLHAQDVVLPSGDLSLIVDEARDLLGLDQEEGAWLFMVDRSKEQVLWALNRLARTGSFDLERCPIPNGNPNGSWVDEED